MSKVLVDRELLDLLRNFTFLHDDGCAGAIRGNIDKALAAQPAEEEGVRAVEFWVMFDATTPEPYIKKMMPEGFLAFFDHEENAIRAKSFHPGTDYKRVLYVRQSDHLAALSAVTAERDRLESTLIQTTTRHFAQQWKDRADDKKLDECLSEGIAMLEAERDQYRAEVEASGWIPLTKATPPDGVPVLRWPGWAAEFSIDEWCNDYGCFLMSIEGGERATHWKPLCAPKAAMAAKEA